MGLSSQKLTADELDTWMDDRAEELSTRTLRLIHQILERAIRHGQARDKVRGNAASLILVPEGQEGTRPRPRQWSEMPVWRTFPGVWEVDPGAALAAGLTCRPLDATVADTRTWLRSTGMVPDDERAGEIGLSRDRERQILASVA